MNATMWRMFVGMLFVGLALTASVGTADAFNSWLNQLTTRYGNTGTQAASCQVCHVFADPDPDPSFNPYGAALAATGFGSAAAIAAVEGDNADVVAGTNLEEIQAGAQPGWCNPATPNCDNAGRTPPPGLALDASSPVANAGPDQSVNVGQTVMLDGRDSFDPDGNPLTYAWSFVLPLPAGSGATLSNPTAVQPTFTADVAGTYTVQLIVNDGQANSAADMVEVTAAPAANLPPVANAGEDQSVQVGAMVTLNGGGSTDPDGNPLTYAWSFVLPLPAGSGATLSNPTAVQPTFTADVAGTYTVQLIVNDGQVSSEPDMVLINAAAGNLLPTANAGLDQAVNVGQTVTLEGGQSTDPDGDPLTYAWSFISRPAGSTAELSDPTAAQPTFVADAAGDFVVQLVVNDGTANSAPDTVVIQAGGGNLRPTADAGPNQTVDVAQTVTLNGSGSSDPEASPLAYAWSFVSRPAGSAATLSDATLVQPTFVADVAGEYVVQLVVNDGTVNSLPDTVIVSVQSPGPEGLDLAVTNFKATKVLKLGKDPEKSVRLRVWIKNVGQTAGDAPATLVGLQNGAEVYRETITVSVPVRKKVHFDFPSYTPTAAGEIAWTVTIQDENASNNSATAVTEVRERRSEHDDDKDKHDKDKDKDKDEDEHEEKDD